MKTKGKRTIIENVDVEVDVLDMLGKFMIGQCPVGSIT
jgi:hypothetical protein